MLDLAPWKGQDTQSTLYRVNASELHQFLPQAGPLLTPAIARSAGRWDLGAVIDFLQSGNMDLWVVYRGPDMLAAVVTQIIRYPRMKVCSIPFLGGKRMKDWLYLVEEIEQWAKDQGCKEMESADARNGKWLPVLGDWLKGYIQIRKVL